MMARFLCATVVLLLGVVQAQAQSGAQQAIDLAFQSQLGTLQVRSEPYMRAGQLIGCQLTYSALMRDHLYRAGGYIKVEGSVAFMTSEQTIANSVKVVVHEFDPEEISFKPSPPSRAYLIGEDFKTNLDALVQGGASDTPGALFSIYNIEPTAEMIFEAVALNRLKVGFNSLNGPSDHQLIVELDVEDTDTQGVRKRSDKATSGFMECVKAMLQL